MKTAEQILSELKSIPEQNLIHESTVLEAMENYRDQELEHVVTCNQALTLRIGGLVYEVSQLRSDNQTLQEENTSLRSYIEELENTLGLRNRSNPDLTIDPDSFEKGIWSGDEEKPKSIFERWQNCED